MPERDMRRKVNKQVLRTAANRDAYVQRKSVVLQDSTKQDEKPEDKANTEKNIAGV